MQDIKIDLVYLWVNDKDEKWQEKKRYWANKLGVLNCNPDINADCRYADNSELRYSLRSAEMYAPWINKIFIITDNQVPEWLDTRHPKIRIIDHKEIMPEECLPCFNSAAIEACIDNIPELSEYFLYANDDTFFTSQVEPNDFYDSKGNPIIQLRKQNWTEKDKKNNLYIRTIIHSKNLFTKKYNLPEHFNFYEPAHCIDAYRKSYFIECKNIFKEDFEYVSKAKFRKESTLQRYIINLYSIHKKE